MQFSAPLCLSITYYDVAVSSLGTDGSAVGGELVITGVVFSNNIYGIQGYTVAKSQ